VTACLTTVNHFQILFHTHPFGSGNYDSPFDIRFSNWQKEAILFFQQLEAIPYPEVTGNFKISDVFTDD